MNLNESRSIPLDKEAIMDYAALLADDIIVAAQQVTDSPEQEVDYVSEHDELVESEYGVNDVRTKEWIPVQIIVSSIVASDTVNDGELIVDARMNRSIIGDYVIELVLNGAYRWRKLKELRDYLVKAVYENLIHELTHVADYQYRDGKNHSYHKQDGSIDDDRYYSDKFEVTAFVQEVTDEAVRRAEQFTRARRGQNYTREQLLDYIEKGPSYKDRVPQLKPSDRARVLKAVYTALVDAGLV